MAGRKPGTPKTGGRAAGVQNKLTREVKEMVLEALSKAGGAEYLYEQSRLNPVAFMTLVGKVLPLQVTGESGGPVVINLVKYGNRQLGEE